MLASSRRFIVRINLCLGVRHMNAAMNVVAHEDPVGKDTEHKFNGDFWEPLDIVVNGLDNIEARLYVDERCVEFKKPLLESGLRQVIPGRWPRAIQQWRHCLQKLVFFGLKVVSR